MPPCLPRTILPCLFLLLSTAGAHAQMPPQQAPAMSAGEIARMQASREAMQAWHARMAGELAASGKARELALAATLLALATREPPQDAGVEGDAPSQPAPRDPRIDQWRRLASARAGSDVLANVLLMQADSGTAADTQVRAEAIERWRMLEPGNLAPRLYAGADIDLLLADARLMDRHDMHWYAQARWLQSAFLAHPQTDAERAAIVQAQDAVDEALPPGETAAMAGMGIMLAAALPGLQPLTEACRDEALSSTPTRREDCRHVAQVMADTSDTGLGTNIGIALLEQVAANGAERAQAQARRRRMDWQMLAWGRAAASQPNGGATQFVRLLRDPSVRSEQDLAERVLEEAGIPLDPPAGWQSPRR